MKAPEEIKQKQDDIDWRREEDVKKLKVQWYNYGGCKRVSLCKQFPEVAECILELIDKVK